MRKINLYILPSINGTCYVTYKNSDINIINYSKEKCNFLDWCYGENLKDDKHHWYPSEAIRFMKKICKNENIPYDDNDTIVLKRNFAGKDLDVYYPKGTYSYSDFNGLKLEGDYRIFIEKYEKSMYESLFVGRWTCGTIINKKPKNDLKILLICDSMCHQIIPNLATACKMITWVDNRNNYDLSKINVKDYDKIFAVKVNGLNSKSNEMNRHVLRTLNYFNEKINHK